MGASTSARDTPAAWKRIGVPDALRTETEVAGRGGMKQCFIGAFTADGAVLWTTGGGIVHQYDPRLME